MMEEELEYIEYLKDFNERNKPTLGFNCSGSPYFPMTKEEFIYRKTLRYKLKEWFKKTWVYGRWCRFTYRLKCIWWAITDLDRLDNY